MKSEDRYSVKPRIMQLGVQPVREKPSQIYLKHFNVSDIRVPNTQIHTQNTTPTRQKRNPHEKVLVQNSEETYTYTHITAQVPHL